MLSRVIEPGVRVEKVMLTANTPAIRLFPATPGPHPIALMAHGNGGSKEMLFRFGEALTAAGFECYSVDLAGYGESPQSCSLTNVDLNFQEAYQALGAVDVFIGHSLGGGVGAWSVREAGFRPKLFIGVGANVNVGKQGPPLILLFSRFDEFRPLFATSLTARTNAQVVFSPWCEHITEAYDPVLVRAGVKAACAAVGKPVPAAPTAWRWRFAGLVLGMAGALGLMFRLPELHPRLAQTRRFIVPAVLLIAAMLTMATWVGVIPQWRRIPQQLVLMVLIWLALAGLSRLRLPRWSLAVVTGILALVCLLIVACLRLVFVNGIFLFATLLCTLGVSTLLLLPGLLVGRIAAHGGSRRDGDVAMAIFAGYVIGEFVPVLY
jgi:pimeloyl-ACP methyl ester carboxylesterase